MEPLRNLLVAGTNELLKAGEITLLPSGQDRRLDDNSGHIFVEIGGRPSVVAWSDIGFDEFRISVWWDFDLTQHPQANKEGNFRERFLTSRPLAKRQHYPKFVGACVSGWLERRDGAYLQGKGTRGLFDRYIRSGTRDDLLALPDFIPTGFAAEGRLHM